MTSNSSADSLIPSSSASQLTTVTDLDTTITPNNSSKSLQDVGAASVATSKTRDSSVDTSSSRSSSSQSTNEQGQPSSEDINQGSASVAGDGNGSSVFRKMTKSLGTAKEAFVKFAKNE